MNRRLPIYLLVDCSSAMAGVHMENVRWAIKNMLSDFRSTPQVLEEAHLSVIAFNSAVQQVAPLTDLFSFEEPMLTASGLASLGLALDMLMDRVKNEERQWDREPEVFILTGGVVSDLTCFLHAAAALPQKWRWKINIFVTDPDADREMLKRIGNRIFPIGALLDGCASRFLSMYGDS